MMDFVDKDISEMKPVEPLSLEGIPFTLVEEINDLKDLAAKLSSVDEFAVNTFLFLSFFLFFFSIIKRNVQCSGGCKSLIML